MPVTAATIQALEVAANAVILLANESLNTRMEHCDCCDRDKAVDWTEFQAQKSLVSAAEKILKITAELDRKRQAPTLP